MTQLAAVAQYLTTAAFIALGAAMAYRWYRQRGRAQAMLALSIISLAAVAAIGRLQNAGHPSTLLALASIVLFIASGYFVLLFRNELLPLSRTALRAANALLAVSVILGVVDVIALAHADPRIMTAVLLALVGAWAIFTGEPIVRFWLASNSLPSVQRARMRFLSGGFAVLIAVLLASVLDSAALQTPGATLAVQVVVLLVVPAIYVSFAPPSMLRRIWRMGEESELRRALQELLVFSSSRKELADRATFWAVRMMGASAGFVVDADGTVLATTGIDPSQAATLISREGAAGGSSSERIVVAPLHLTGGQGFLAVVAGRFTPVFGTDEVTQLRAYASSVAAGLERVQVTERIAALESNKSQFLNLASHELRGPITVIRGYVSMLEAGLLGELNDRGRTAAGVMAAKVTEMNELIEEMIETARLEDGALSLRMVETELRELAREAAENIAPMVDAQHEIRLDLPDRRVRVNVDPDRTKTIITNLLSNAIKYSPQGGVVTCQVRARAGTARVAVSDEGLGIAPEGIATLFTRFGRVVTPDTQHLKGTGLGLFLGRQLARLQGGDITVVSSEGRGSTFTLHLPVAAAAAPQDGATPEVLSVEKPVSAPAPGGGNMAG